MTGIPTTMTIEPIEADGKWWVDVSASGHQLMRLGPYSSASRAQNKAAKLTRKYQPKGATKGAAKASAAPVSAVPAAPVPAPTSDNTIILNGKSVALDSDVGRKLVVDATRAAEGLIDDKVIQEIYEITPSDWLKIADDVKLGRAIREEGRRRVRNGLAAREAAQGVYVKTPAVLDAILSNEKASPRHRIEACREVRAVAIGGSDTETPATAAERFVITFHMGSDIERIEKDVTPRPKQIASEFDAVPTSENKIDAE